MRFIQRPLLVNVSRASQHAHPAVSSRFRTSFQPRQPALLQGDGLGRVLAFLGSTLAGEILALNVPKAISVVESEDMGEKKPGELPLKTKAFKNQNCSNLRERMKRGEKEMREMLMSHPSSWPLRMSLELKKAMRGNLRSWCSMNTRTGMRFGSHRWLMKRLIFP